jgi:hypothetical protein
MSWSIVGMFVPLAFVTVASFAGTPDTSFTYQGELRQAGVLVDGLYDFEFSLWDSLSGGTQLGADFLITDVPITNGVFAVELDFGAEAFDNSARWLQVVVEGTALSPRQPITRAPYALQTRGIYVDEDHNVGIGTTQPVFPLHVVMDDFAFSKGHAAIFVENVLATNFTYGVFARSNSPDGRGVYGEASSDTGATRGVHGHTDSSSGFAGYFTGPDGSKNYFQRNVGIGTTSPQYALDIETDDVIGLRVVQDSAALSSGIRCESNTSAGDAIVGHATGGSANGVAGRSDGATGVGIVGLATHLSGANRGVIGETLSTTGIGVYASASNAGINYALVASASGEDGYAGYFVGGRNYMNGFLGLNKLEPEVRLDVVGSIQYTGTITDVSDIRLKENIEPLVDALDKVQQIDGVYFNMIESPEEREVGLIAQNVREVLPEAVRIVDSKAGHLGVSDPSLTPLLIEAIKSLRAEKDAELATLREENDALRQRLEALEAAVTQLTSMRKD